MTPPRALGHWLADRGVRRALIAVSALYAIALLAPLLTPYDPTAFADPAHPRHFAPSLAHPFGTDLYGRDLLSRMLYGARVSLLVALLSVLIAVTIGTAVGAVAGFAGGVVDDLLMRIVDAGLAIPRIFLVLAVLALWENVAPWTLVAILGTTGWFTTSRLVRAEVLSVRAREYAVAARATGMTPWRALRRHILPNALAPVVVTATLGIGNIILIEAGLSYLGFGIPQPHPSWGSIINDGRDFLLTAPWVSTLPGLAIAGTVMAFAALGDGLQRVLDPRRR